MKKIKEKLEALGAAVAFAEADEAEEAVRLVKEADRVERREGVRKDSRQRPRARVYRT